MKFKLILTICILAFATATYAQDKSKWENWTWLSGEWIGLGSGQPGEGSGSFSFAFDLDKNILVRKGHTEFSAVGNKKASIHDDLMIIYTDGNAAVSKAVYFDNEGHTINYSISYIDKTIVFTSDKIANTPIFRLTYSMLDNEMLNIKFEMSRDGQNFMTYIEGKSKKKK